ncbi:hypothetical protein [Nocardioides sambongensis]|uniref:hypothetical protein n=1 Tax=Nocardioides sambongensis TaxID=2589074 RepID=UPI0011283069|nr:hypothetical protein [Nocardioides sambongensis]
MSERRKLVIAVVLAAVLAVAVGTQIGPRVGSADGSSVETAASADAAPDVNSDGELSTAAEPGDRQFDAPAEDGGEGRGGSANSADGNGGVEVMPEDPAQTTAGLPGLDNRSSGERGGDTPLPDRTDFADEPQFSDGKLAEGYPEGLLPIAPGSTVVNSSVSPSEGRVQVALVGQRRRSEDALLRFYRQKLSSAGFTEGESLSVGSAESAAFERDGSTVVVTLDPGAGRTYSVYATLLVEGA